MMNQRSRWFRSVRFRFTLVYAGLLGGTGITLVTLFYSYIQIAGLAQVATRPTDATLNDLPATAPEPKDPFASNLIFIALALLVILTAMWVSWWIAGRLLRPLDSINETAMRIAQGDLSHRVALDGPDDEFASLARALNSMLTRLHQALDAHRRFAANASHELRTPLATNKAMLSVALQDPGDTDFIELTRRLHMTNEESIGTVEALLDLADMENATFEPEVLDLSTLVGHQLDHAHADMAAEGLIFETALASAPTTGSAVLWNRLLGNLIQNAIRHNLRGGTVWVFAGVRDGRPFVQIENTGRVIPPELVPNLTEPFVRARGRTSAGAVGSRGLGLSIVASIADAHHARLTIAARDSGGLSVVVQADVPQSSATRIRQTRQALPSSGSRRCAA
jgi:two-component system sensor histidine kinase VanS